MAVIDYNHEGTTVPSGCTGCDVEGEVSESLVDTDCELEFEENEYFLGFDIGNEEWYYYDTNTSDWEEAYAGCNYEDIDADYTEFVGECFMDYDDYTVTVEYTFWW